MKKFLIGILVFLILGTIVLKGLSNNPDDLVRPEETNDIETMENGTENETSYDVIDGKQRLNTIIQFIESMVSLPMDFGTDEYGYTKMNGLKMSEIE